MEENRSYYLVIGIHRFDECCADDHPLVVEEGNPTHFCPAFETKEEANKFSAGRFPILMVSNPKPGGPTLTH